VRVLFTTTGHSGHLLPLVPLAQACQRAGHDIAIATHASRTAAVERVGLPAHAVEEAPETAWAPLMSRLPRLRQADADALIIAEGFARTAGGAALPGVLDVVDEFTPDVLVHECYEFAGPIAAESRGIASARVALGLTSTEAWVSDLAARTVGRRRPSPLLSMVPPGLDDGPAFRFRDGTPPAAPPLPAWWANAQEPLVYLTFGSVTGSLAFFPALYRNALEALGSLPIRVLLTIGRDADPAALGPLPSNAHVAPWVAQHEVLPHAAAVVSHGGYGTTLGALAHGVPLVLLPLFAGDQWRTARRVAQVGAGLLLEDGERRTFDPPGPRLMAALPGALRRVAGDPRFARTARHVGREMAMLPPARAAVGVLEAAAHSRARSARSWLAGASGAPAQV
jgi:UDP:flavonoid glycosyltransferase YjiC (YdhE family)